MKLLVLIMPTVLLIGFASILASAASESPDGLTAGSAQSIPLTRAELRKLSATLDSMEGEAHHVLPRGGLSN